MEKNFEVNNLVSFDDYLYESEKTHTEKIKSAIIERISSSLTYKGVIGQPKEQLIQSIKTGLAKIVDEKIIEGVDPVLRKDKPENCIIYEDEHIALGFENNPVPDKRPYVLWINLKPARREKFMNFILKRIQCSNEMATDLFKSIPEDCTELIINLYNQPKPVVLASRISTGGTFLWQDVANGKFIPNNPIAYLFKDHVWISYPDKGENHEWTFKFPK